MQNINCNMYIIMQSQKYHLSHNGLQRLDNFWCCTINVLCETPVLEPYSVGLYTLGEGGLKKCTVCTLLKMVAFLYAPKYSIINMINKKDIDHIITRDETNLQYLFEKGLFFGCRHMISTGDCVTHSVIRMYTYNYYSQEIAQHIFFLWKKYILFLTHSIRSRYIHTLKRLSCRTFLMATSSPVSLSLAWYTTPNDPLPMTLVSVYDTSCGRSGPCPGVATTVVTLLPSLPKTSIQISHI